MAVFSAASFLSAALLFLVQPMIGKMLLPFFGGSPAVWTTAILFFQALLLAGYGYAHASTRLLPPRRQSHLHLAVALAPLLTLPIALPDGPGSATHPTTSLLWVLLVTAGAPFLLLSTSGPLLQRWFATTRHRAARDPYFLYATGNAGSLLGLVGYLFLVEPHLSLRTQARLWSVGYVVAIALLALCARHVGQPADDDTAERHTPDAARPSRADGLRWVGLAFLPSSAMLGVTTFATTDIAAVPLLWVVPLMVYLLTFVVAFAVRGERWLRVPRTLLAPAVVLVVVTMARGSALPVVAALASHLLLFTVLALTAHGRLAAQRPHPTYLTHYYVCIAVGGALGGLVNGVLAPALLPDVYEYPLVLAAALAVLLWRPAGRAEPAAFGERFRRAAYAFLFAAVPVAIVLVTARRGDTAGALLGGATAAATGLAVVAAARHPRATATALAALLMVGLVEDAGVHKTRTFFGVHVVHASDNVHTLMHGSTVHGSQDRRPEQRRTPRSYYHPHGPAGDVFAAYGATLGNRVGVVGLGAGSIAAYGRPGQHFTFFEIDHAVRAIATDPSLFSYLADTPARVDVVVGDGRLTLRDTHERFGVLVLDAFTSDAIPVHLLTREAVQDYLARLDPRGVLAFHVSNRHLELEPVLAAIAADLGLTGLARRDNRGDTEAGRHRSHWVVLTRPGRDLAALAARGWHDLGPAAKQRTWTDDYSNILGVLRGL